MVLGMRPRMVVPKSLAVSMMPGVLRLFWFRRDLEGRDVAIPMASRPSSGKSSSVKLHKHPSGQRGDAQSVHEDLKDGLTDAERPTMQSAQARIAPAAGRNDAKGPWLLLVAAERWQDSQGTRGGRFEEDGEEERP
jgi:hypothetical protein